MADKKGTVHPFEPRKTSPHQQILAALDTLGGKLVRSETERDRLKKLLNEAMDAQERLENQLERSHIDMQRRIDSLEEGRQDDTIEKALHDMLEEQRGLLDKAQEQLGDYENRQIVVEDKLNDNNQLVSKLQRRIDSQEKKRARLERRMERVENIAIEAQNALSAKSLVLLTDQSQATQSLPHMNAAAPLPSIDYVSEEKADRNRPAKGGAFQFSYPRVIGLTVLLLLAMGLGWLLAKSAPSSEDFTVVTRGSNTMGEDVILPSGMIEEDLALLSTEWVTEDVISQSLSESTPSSPQITGSQENTGAPFDAEIFMMAQQPDAALTDEITPDASLPETIKTLEDKAFNGVAEAQHDMAALYTSGQAGVTQNYERAIDWFKLAARQGIANAAYNLGVMYQQGMGTAQDMDLALNWYRRAAQLGHAEAQYNLGIAYIEGIGTPYNPNMAAAFFKEAAFGGINEAAYNLGLILENGLLGEVRARDALIWYRAASENGNEEALAALQALSNRMNIAEDDAGLLEDGTSLASYIAEDNAGTITSDETANLPTNVTETINLGSLLPTEAQILVAQIQEQLRQIGYYDGPQDGIAGASTVEAIKSYQIREELPADGVASESLLAYMLAERAY